jgi:CheY-like chemotaxis protein
MLTKQNDPLNILLADDDKDDRLFFKKAVNEINIATALKTVNDGEQLMEYLFINLNHLPDILFLDLNMPRKNGFECLTEIKGNEQLLTIPVIMFSTSYPRDIVYEQDMINRLYRIGAQNYIRKPGEFIKLKQVIHTVLHQVTGKKLYKEEDENILKPAI